MDQGLYAHRKSFNQVNVTQINRLYFLVFVYFLPKPPSIVCSEASYLSLVHGQPFHVLHRRKLRYLHLPIPLAE